MQQFFNYRKRFLEVPPDPRTNFERRSETADRICPPPCMSEVNCKTDFSIQFLSSYKLYSFDRT